MGNDIEIRVSVANNTGAGITAVNNSLRRLRDEARDAGRGLDGLTARAAAATVALRALKDSAQDAARALRSLNTAARNADGRLDTMSNRTRTLRRDTDDLDDSMRRLTTTLGGLGGSTGRINLSTSSNSMNDLRKAALLLSPALIPIAAAAAPIAAGLGAATVAVGAFGLAIGGQVVAMAGVAEASKKYQEAVQTHGRTSDEAAKAGAAYSQVLANMDPETRKAAAGFATLSKDYKQWSKDLAGDTMPVVTKSLATFGALLPALAPTVRATSTELDRLMTVLAGGVNSAGFDQLTSAFSEFASGTIQRATDGLVHFMRTLSEGGGSSQFSEFMQYVREVGPQVGETLGNLARALTHLVAAASETGVGLLTVVNSFSKLVNAIPTEALSNLIQFVVVFKAVKMAAAGLGGAGGAMAAFGTSIAAMSAASAAAGGGLAGLAAAFGTLSRAAKVALIGSGIGILVVALSELSDIGKKAPPDVDKLTTSLRELGTGGTVAGEAARSFGKDLSGLADSLEKVTDPKGLDQVQQSIMSFFGTDSTPVKDAKENIDGLDKALANLVKNGQADLAASALENISAQMKKQGFSSKEITSQLDDYKSALKDAAFEQQLAFQAMGLFGEAAQDTSAKLAAQQAAADGLRASIVALNDANRSAYEAQIGFEASLDDLAAAFEKNGATLNLNTEAGRANATAMTQAARSQDELIASGLAAGESLGSMTKKSSELRAEMMTLATEAFGGNKKAAEEYVNTLLGAPSEMKTLVKLEREEAIAGLESVRAAIQATPDAKTVTVDTLNGAAIAALEKVGLKTKQLPDGKTQVFTANGQALGSIGAVSTALNNLDGKVANTYINTFYTKTVRTFRQGERDYTNKSATGGLIPRYASGGNVQAAPNGLISGPGSGISDSILALFASGATGLVSDTEFVVNAASTRKHLPLLEAINDDRLPRFAKGGLTDAQKQARKDAMGDLTVSHFGQMAGYKRSEFRSELGGPDSLSALVNALNEWRSNIKKATSGAQEKALLKALDSAGKKLIGWEKQLNSVTKSLEKARDKLNSLKDAAAQVASSVKSGILSSANITRGASGDAPVTVGTVMGGLTESRDKATAFAKALKDLKKKGLSSALIQQIAEAGIEGGGLETAGALLGASSSEISSINDLQQQIDKAAGSAGKTTADALYGKAIAAQEKYVKSLEGQQKKLTESMDKLAKAMEKMVEKAFGKKASGGVVGAAATGGMRSGLTMVGEQGFELLDLPAGARVWSNPDSRRKLAEQAPWASMLNTAPRRAPSAARAAAASAGGGDGSPIVIQLQIGKQQFGELWVDVGRNEVRARGSIEATLKPPRGR